MTSLAAEHDCLLLDLDGTVFRGNEPVVGAVDTLARVTSRVLYITNNASRSGAEVATHLRDLGFAAEPDDVVTSAETAARVLAARLPAGAPVLVVGTESLAAEIANAGLKPVRRSDDSPVAVVQGHSPQTAWSDLAEAALAISAGAYWLATNVDPTLPSERGLLPGNGSMVAALRSATGREPDVAGKPQPTPFTESLTRGDFRAPLVVGDRLDTDIAGANAAGLPSLVVLSGVSGPRDVVYAAGTQRPSYLGHDLRALGAAADVVRIGPQRGWRVDEDAGQVTIFATDEDPGDDLAVVRVVADAMWGATSPYTRLAAGDDLARSALNRWALLG